MYPNPFNPYPTVNPAYLQQANAPHINTGNQIVKVNGRNGAEMFQMAPNSSALLLDESAPMIWLAQTDGAGYKTLTAYDIKPHEEVPVPDMKSLEERITKIEEALRHESDYTSNVKQVAGNEYVRSSSTDDPDGKVLR